MNSNTTYDAESKVWRGPSTQRVFAADCSVGRIAFSMMRSKSPTEICQICDSEGVTLTYGEALTYAIRVAQQLSKLGITQDDVVGVVAPNTTMLLPVIIGCWLHGTAVHTVGIMHEKSVFKYLLNITKPKLIFCDGKIYEDLKIATEDFQTEFYTICNHVTGVTKIEELLKPTTSEHFYQPQPLKYGPTQTAAILCTSGTTGLPKAVTMSSQSLTVDFGFIHGSDIMFNFSSADWAVGLHNIIFSVLYGGRRIITTQPFDADYLLDLLVKYKVTFLAITSRHLVQLSQSARYNKSAMAHIQKIFMAGGSCNVASMERIRASLTPPAILLNGYGVSECGGIASNYGTDKLDSVGKLLPNVCVKIVNVEEDEGETSVQSLGPKQVGEVCVQNNGNWCGYYGNTTATKRIIDADGWIHTGDLGYFDDEQYLYLLDRCNDIMKYNGIKFTPHTIEAAIAELPDVLEVCVFGVWDEIVGHRAAAAVVRREGSALNAAQIVAHVKGPKEEVPTPEHKWLNGGVYFVPQLIRNSNGKVVRRKMKEFCLAQDVVNGSIEANKLFI